VEGEKEEEAEGQDALVPALIIPSPRRLCALRTSRRI